jgi:hypothetical protein
MPRRHRHALLLHHQCRRRCASSSSWRIASSCRRSNAVIAMPRQLAVARMSVAYISLSTARSPKAFGITLSRGPRAHHTQRPSAFPSVSCRQQHAGRRTELLHFGAVLARLSRFFGEHPSFSAKLIFVIDSRATSLLSAKHSHTPLAVAARHLEISDAYRRPQLFAERVCSGPHPQPATEVSSCLHLLGSSLIAHPMSKTILRSRARACVQRSG